MHFHLFIKILLNEMSALDINNLLIEQKPLHVPALSEIAEGEYRTNELKAENFRVKYNSLWFFFLSFFFGSYSFIRWTEREFQ